MDEMGDKWGSSEEMGWTGEQTHDHEEFCGSSQWTLSDFDTEY